MSEDTVPWIMGEQAGIPGNTGGRNIKQNRQTFGLPSQRKTSSEYLGRPSSCKRKDAEISGTVANLESCTATSGRKAVGF